MTLKKLSLRNLVLGYLVASAIIGIPTRLLADSSTSVSSDDSGWSFSMAPYAWVTAISGETGVKGVSADIDLSMGDVLEDLNGALMFSLNARHGRWTIITDFLWAQLEDSTPTPKGELFTRAKLTLNEIIWTQALGYSVVQCEDASLDLLGGFRLMSLNTELELDGGLLASRDFSDTETWIDPIIGVRGQIALNDDFFFRMMGDIGGFNAASSLTWQALAAFGYHVGEQTSLGAGYRALSYDYDRDSFKYDATMYGPFLGAEFRF